MTPQLDGTSAYERHLALKQKATDRSALIVAAGRGLDDPDWRVAATACTLAIENELKELVPRAVAVLQAMQHDDERLEYVIRLVGLLGRTEDAPAVRPYLRHLRAAVRVEALTALDPERLGRAEQVAWLMPLARDKDRRVRDRAITVLLRFPGQEAQVFVAGLENRVDRLAALGATAPLLKRIREARGARRVEMLKTITDVDHANVDLMAAILNDPDLAEIHPRALVELMKRGGLPATVEQATARLRAQYQARIDEHLATCRTADWYQAFAALKQWAQAEPRLAFLDPMLARGIRDCRQSALQVLEHDATLRQSTRSP